MQALITTTVRGPSFSVHRTKTMPPSHGADMFFVSGKRLPQQNIQLFLFDASIMWTNGAAVGLVDSFVFRVSSPVFFVREA